MSVSTDSKFQKHKRNRRKMIKIIIISIMASYAFGAPAEGMEKQLTPDQLLALMSNHEFSSKGCSIIKILCEVILPISEQPLRISLNNLCVYIKNVLASIEQQATCEFTVQVLPTSQRDYSSTGDYYAYILSKISESYLNVLTEMKKIWDEYKPVQDKLNDHLIL